MEPVEEFSFKPITEGLGFHRKKSELNESLRLNRRVSDAHVLEVPLAPTKPNTESKVLKSPLPKKESPAPSFSSPAVSLAPMAQTSPNKPNKDVIDEIVRGFKKTNQNLSQEPLAAKESIPKVIVPPTKPKVDEASNPLPWMLSPFIVDALLVMALFLSGLLVTVSVTGVDLLKVFRQGADDLILWMTLPAIALAMLFVYMVTSRILLGASLGELMFDLRLGSQQDRRRIQYGIQVVLRTSLATISGFIILPLVSMLTQQDLLGELSGLRLYRKKRGA